MEDRLAGLQATLDSLAPYLPDDRTSMECGKFAWMLGEIGTLRAELRLALDALKQETQSTERYCEVCNESATLTDEDEIAEPLEHGRQCPIGRLEALLAERA